MMGSPDGGGDGPAGTRSSCTTIEFHDEHRCLRVNLTAGHHLVGAHATPQLLGSDAHVIYVIADSLLVGLAREDGAGEHELLDLAVIPATATSGRTATRT